MNKLIGGVKQGFDHVADAMKDGFQVLETEVKESNHLPALNGFYKMYLTVDQEDLADKKEDLIKLDAGVNLRGFAGMRTNKLLEDRKKQLKNLET